MSERHPSWRGDRRLRVALELTRRGIRVAGVSLLEGPAVQRPTLAGDVAVRVDVGGELALVDAVEDPRIERGVSRRGKLEHSYRRHAAGTLVVEVPFGRGAALHQVGIRVASLARLKTRSTDPLVVARYFEEPTRGVREFRALALADLVSHPDWERVAPAVGVAPETRAAFEIYVDSRGRYRWRLRRPDGRIVAASAQAYGDRGSCERDLRWIRHFGLSAEVRSLDVRPARSSAGRKNSRRAR